MKVLSVTVKSRTPKQMQVCFVGNVVIGYTRKEKPIVRKLSFTRHLHLQDGKWWGLPLPGQNLDRVEYLPNPKKVLSKHDPIKVSRHLSNFTHILDADYGSEKEKAA